ncbi:MAG: DUF269 domain-containing protein [Spirochaetia bacterium]|nr:DUF269 domain-containing protein [Spirochaetia bacterium]
MEIKTQTQNFGENFYQNLVKQIRATDAYGSYVKYSDDELAGLKYLKNAGHDTASLKNDQTALNIKMYLQAVCVTLEKLTSQITGLMSESGCDGSVQALIYSGDLIILNKTFGGINGFQYSSVEKLKDSGGKLVEKLVGTMKTKAEKYEAFVASL